MNPNLEMMGSRNGTRDVTQRERDPQLCLEKGQARVNLIGHCINSPANFLPSPISEAQIALRTRIFFTWQGLIIYYSATLQ